MRLARSNQETDAGKHALPCLTQKASYKGLCADSVEKHEPASDIDTAVVDSLKALDPNRPIREADIVQCGEKHRYSQLTSVQPSAAFTRSRVSGSSRMRLPVALAKAFTIAATAGPCDPSPAPSDFSAGRSMSSTSTCGTSCIVRIG